MCGKSNRVHEIYGGEETLPHEYPWNVYLRGGCGGSLISNQHVLTAAHCMKTSPDKIKVHMGMNF